MASEKEETLFQRFMVGKYDTLRDFFRYTFLAGCFTVKEYERFCNIKTDNINNFFIPRLKKINEKTQLELRPQRASYSVLDIVPEWFVDGGMPVWCTYKLHTAKPKQIYFYFLMLSALQNKESMRDIDIQERLELLSDKGVLKACSDSDETLLKMEEPIKKFDKGDRLKELKQQGLIVQQGKGKPWKAVENILDSLTEQEQYAIYYYAQFYKKLASFSVPGYFLQDTIAEFSAQKECCYSRKDWPEIFCFQNDYFYQMVDDENLQLLYEAWKQKIIVEVQYLKANGYRGNKANDDGIALTEWYKKMKAKPITYKIAPLRVLDTDIYGRRSVLVYTFDDSSASSKNSKKKLQILRLDRMEQVKLQKKVFWPRNFDQYENILRLSWYNNLPSDELINNNFANVPEEMVLDFDFTDCPQRKEQLLLERKHGQLEQIDENHYQLRIQLVNQKEILPWVYSFGRAVKVVQCESAIRTDLQNKAEAVLYCYQNTKDDKLEHEGFAK